MHQTTSRIDPAWALPQKAMRGVTLFELIVVMGIVGILMAIAIPSYQYFTKANRISAEINGLLGDLQFARSEAIREGVSVQACVSTDGLTCASGNNNWHNGWIVLAPSITLPLRKQSAFASTDTLIANNTLATITFNREGFAAGLPTTPAEILTLHASTPTNGSTRCLSIQLIGLMAVQGYDGANCT